MTTTEPVLELRGGRDKSVRRRHPWIFSGSVARVSGSPAAGDTVRVVSAGGETLGRAAWSPASNLRARMWTFDDSTVVDGALIAARIHAAAARREALAPITDAVRLVFSEADGVPGLVADRYGDTVVVQLGTAGADAWRDVIGDALMQLDGVRTVFERSDVEGRDREGLAPRMGLLRGAAPPPEIVVRERDHRFAVGVEAGHKTGFYLDQRDARALIGELAPGRSVLNAFAYTGAFSAIAASAGAQAVATLDSSEPALATWRRNAEINGVDAGEVIVGDAFAELRKLRDRGRTFDLIVLDPPKLAQTEAHVARATRAYKDLNLTATKLLAPGGVLLTFSCSGGVSEELFQKVVAGAALDARRELRIVGRLGQPSDHPVPLSFPEAAYLKGLVLRAD